MRRRQAAASRMWSSSTHEAPKRASKSSARVGRVSRGGGAHGAGEGRGSGAAAWIAGMPRGGGAISKG